jgi:hypothetical protein
MVDDLVLVVRHRALREETGELKAIE